MKIPYYQVDAFSGEVFGGNPAGVCLLGQWLDDATMQAVAAENNLSETAFITPDEEADFKIRWFTPVTEVDLCGHATLASAYVVFNYMNEPSEAITFASRSGPLTVKRNGELLAMNLPRREAAPCDMPVMLAEGLATEPVEVYRGEDYLAVYENERQVRELNPDFEKLARLDCFTIIATAPGEDADFVSRVFAPAQGIPEDPVTGSAHCTLIPYWSKRLGRDKLRALQVSRRGGELFCKDLGDRVEVAGRAVTYLEGVINVD